MSVCKLPKKLKSDRTTSMNRLWLAIVIVTCVLSCLHTTVKATTLLRSSPHESSYSAKTKRLMKAEDIVVDNTRITVEANYRPTVGDDNTVKRVLDTHDDIAHKLSVAQLFHNDLSVMASNRVASRNRGHRVVRDVDTLNDPPKRKRGRPRKYDRRTVQTQTPIPEEKGDDQTDASTPIPKSVKKKVKKTKDGKPKKTHDKKLKKKVEKPKKTKPNLFKSKKKIKIEKKLKRKSIEKKVINPKPKLAKTKKAKSDKPIQRQKKQSHEPSDANKPKRGRGRPRKLVRREATERKETIKAGITSDPVRRASLGLKMDDDVTTATELPEAQLFRSVLSVVRPDHVTSQLSNHRVIRDIGKSLDGKKRNSIKLRKQILRKRGKDDDDMWTSNHPKWSTKRKNQPDKRRRGGPDETWTQRPRSFKSRDGPARADRRRGRESLKSRDGPARADRRRGRESFKSRDGPARADRRRGRESFKSRDGPASADRRRGRESFKSRDGPASADRRRGRESFKSRDGPASADRRRGRESFKSRDGPARADRRRGRESFKSRDGPASADRRRGRESFKSRDGPVRADRRRGRESFKSRDGPASADRRRGRESFKSRDGPASADRRRGRESFKSRDGPVRADRRQGRESFKSRDGPASADRRRGRESFKSRDGPARADRRRGRESFKSRDGPARADRRPGRESFKSRDGPVRADRKRGRESFKSRDGPASPTAERSRVQGKSRTREGLDEAWTRRPGSSQKPDHSIGAEQKRRAESFKDRDRPVTTSAPKQKQKSRKPRSLEGRPEMGGTRNAEGKDGLSTSTKLTQIYDTDHLTKSKPTLRPGSYRPEMIHGKDQMWMPDPPFSLIHPRNYGTEPPRDDPRVPRPVKGFRDSWVIREPKIYHKLERYIPEWRSDQKLTKKSQDSSDDTTEPTLKSVSVDMPRSRTKRMISPKPHRRAKPKQKHKVKQHILRQRRLKSLRKRKMPKIKSMVKASLLTQRKLLKKQRKKKISKRRDDMFYLGRARDVKEMLADKPVFEF